MDKLIEIFKAGKHTAMNGQALTFSESDLKATIEAYNPEVYEAPIVVGHPKTDAPAYGWAKSLSFTEDGKIAADAHQVDAQFADLVSEGKFKKISASFFAPDAANNPVPGVWYLKHIGFLGAQAPAVKGLKSVTNFADDSGVYEFADWDQMTIAGLFRKMREWIIGEKGIDEANKVLPEYEINSLNINAAQADDRGGMKALFSEPNDDKDDYMTPEQKARMEALEAENKQLKADNTKLKDDNAAFSEAEEERKQTMIHDSNVAFADALIKDGKLLPADKDATVVVLDQLAKSDDVVAFGEGDGKQEKTALQAHKDTLLARKKIVEFGEHETGESQESGSVSFASPPGFSVDPNSLELHNKAQDYAAANKVSYEEALTKVA